MHILVTGASGFVGSRLCTELVKAGNSVTGISRSGRRLEKKNDSSKIGIEDTGNSLAGGPSENSYLNHIEMLACDLVSKEDTQRALKTVNQKVDCVIHLAGLTFSQKEPMPSPQDYFTNNVMATFNLLEYCRLSNIRSFIFSSSIAVYGLSAGQYSPNYLPVDEKHNARPYEFYDASKLHAEQLCRYYHDRFNISSVILRYSRVYGPGQEKGIVYQAIRKALEDKPIDVRGDISTDFVYVDDVVRATLLAAIRQPPAIIEDVNDDNIVFNIGSGIETTLHELCSTIVRLTGSSSAIKYSSYPKGRFWLDISKAMRVLQYQPIILEEGLIKSIQYIRNSLK